MNFIGRTLARIGHTIAELLTGAMPGTSFASHFREHGHFGQPKSDEDNTK